METKGREIGLVPGGRGIYSYCGVWGGCLGAFTGGCTVYTGIYAVVTSRYRIIPHYTPLYAADCYTVNPNNMPTSAAPLAGCSLALTSICPYDMYIISGICGVLYIIYLILIPLITPPPPSYSRLHLSRSPLLAVVQLHLRLLIVCSPIPSQEPKPPSPLSPPAARPRAM